MDFDLQAIMDFNTRTPVRGFSYVDVPQYLRTWRQEAALHAPGSQNLPGAHTVTPGAYLHSPQVMGTHGSHIPSPPASQPESLPGQTLHASQQQMIDYLRNEKDRLVSDKDRLMNDKDKLVCEKDALLDDKRALLEARERSTKDSDDLLSSKTRLWQEYYQATKSRDEEIMQLTDGTLALKQVNAGLEEELAHQKRKNRRLAKALDHYIERDEDSGAVGGEAAAGVIPEQSKEHKIDCDDVDKRVPVSKASKVERTASWIETVAEPEQRATESRKQMAELFGSLPVDHCLKSEGAEGEMLAAQPSVPIARLSRELGSDTRTRLPSQCTDITESMDEECQPQQNRPDTPPLPGIEDVAEDSVIMLEAARSPACDSVRSPITHAAETPEQHHELSKVALLAKLKDNFLAPRHYTIRPLFQLTSDQGRQHGDVSELSCKVLQSLVEVFELCEKSHRMGKCPKTPVARIQKGCAYMWASAHTSNVVWTDTEGRSLTCLHCFRYRRACVLWQGDNTWELLPLPAQLRTPGATYRDAGYFIYEGNSHMNRVRSMWGSSTQQIGRKRKAEEYAAVTTT